MQETGISNIAHPWLKAARLRTLPLALSGALLAACMSATQTNWNYLALPAFVLTILLLQILSNFANDLGDGLKGTDDNREGELRMIASGIITHRDMKRAIWLLSVLAFLSGCLALYFANITPEAMWFLGALGLTALWAAIQYTMGKRAYGYMGWGDVFVFLFFGLASVSGGSTLLTGTFQPLYILPGISMGFLSVAVLNLNNMRDRENDAAQGKKTLVVRWGLSAAKRYHFTLLFLAVSSAFVYFRLQGMAWYTDMYLLTIPILGILLRNVARAKQPQDFEPELKKQALTTLLFALLTGLSHFYA